MSKNHLPDVSLFPINISILNLFFMGSERYVCNL